MISEAVADFIVDPWFTGCWGLATYVWMDETLLYFPKECPDFSVTDIIWRRAEQDEEQQQQKEHQHQQVCVECLISVHG
jgi:hypothetical protein